jgi:hypothetical protein
MSLLTLTNDFLSRGINIIPVQYKHKEPDARLLPLIDGKASWEPFKKSLVSPELLEAWFSGGQHNYGVVAGWQDLVIIDFDDMAEYNRWLIWATKTGGIARFVAEMAYKVQTARGVHVYVTIPGGGSNRKAGKVDIKFRGYVLGPESIHPSGAKYTALTNTMVFPQVERLADILPAHLLAEAKFDGAIKTPVQTTTKAVEVTDPWLAAWNATQTPQTGLVKKIKEAVKIESFFTDLTQTKGNYYVTRCPFHDDRHPSFWVNTEHQNCNCWSCSFPKALDVIDLYARLYGVSNADAIRALGGAL